MSFATTASAPLARMDAIGAKAEEFHRARTTQEWSTMVENHEQAVVPACGLGSTSPLARSSHAPDDLRPMKLPALRRLACLAAASMLLMTSAAVAQKAPKGAKGGKAPAPAAAPAPAPTPAPSGGIDELDDPRPAAKPASSGSSGGMGGICEIDPAACPKAEDIAAAANRSVQEELFAMQQVFVVREGRFELSPFWTFTLNDQFVSHPSAGLAMNYYLTQDFAIGLRGQSYYGLNIDSSFNFENRRATRVAVPLNEYLWGASANATYVPIYGKFAGFQKFIFSYDVYGTAGVSALSTRPIPVIDPNNRNFDYGVRIGANVGVGLRIFFNRWFALNLEVRDTIYPELLENLKVAENPIDKAKWDGETRITNNVEAGIGFTMFFPTTFEYRLPK
jgi:outer membrane beta-barrel protein